MTRTLISLKRCAHPKYKFVVREKVGGKLKRRYFRNEEEAAAYAQQGTAASNDLKAIIERLQSEAPAKIARPDSPSDGAGERAIPSGAQTRTAVVILGMHRSGTSALCGALNVLGVNFGRNLAPAGPDNEKGYWEHPEIVALHDELLRLLNSRWDDDAPLPADWVKSDDAQEIQSLLLGVLERDFSGFPLFGLKDPRMCRLLPLWIPIFEKLHVRPHFVLTTRHPWEVAQSLAKRDKLDSGQSYLLWLEHTFQAEAATRSFPRSFVSYESLMENPVATLTHLQKELGISSSISSRKRNALSKFLSRSLRHHHAPADEQAATVPPLALEVYKANSADLSAAGISEKISDLGEQFKRSSALFIPRISALEARIANLDRYIPGKSGEAGHENLVRLEVFHPLSDGYRESNSQARYFSGGSWKLVMIDLPAVSERSDRPLRIDAATFPAVIDIAEIALKRPTTGEVLWSATSEKEFTGFEVGGSACRLFHERYLRVLSFGDDPQLLLPTSTAALLETPTRLELLILVDNRAEAISRCVTAMQKQAEWKARAAAGPFLVVYADQGQGFIEEHSVRAPLQMDAMQTICFDDFEELCPTEPVRLRIDPVDRPAIITISRIRIIQNADDVILYAAENAQDFEKIRLTEEVSRHSSGDNLLLVATNSDPQLHLPAFEKIAGENARLEITIEAQSATPDVLRRFRQAFQERDTLEPALKAARLRLEQLEASSQVWETTSSELKSSLETSYAEVGRLTSQTQASEAKISDLQSLIEQTREESGQLSAELESERVRSKEALEALAAQHTQHAAALETEMSNLQGFIEQARTESVQLSAQLEAERAGKKETLEAFAAQQAAALEAEVSHLQGLIEQARTESIQLSVELESERAGRKEALKALAAQYSAARETEVENLQALIEQARTESVQLLAQLEAERAGKKEALEALAAQHAQHALSLEIEVGNLQGLVEKARTESIEVSTELEAERVRKKEELEALAAQHAQHARSFQIEVGNLQGLIEKARTESVQLSAELKAERARKEEVLKTQSARHSAHVTTLEAEMRNLQTQVERAGAEAAKLRVDLGAERSKYRDSQEDLSLAGKQIAAFQLEIAGLNNLVAENRRHLNALTTQVEAERAQIREQRTQLESAAEQLGLYETEIHTLRVTAERARTEANQLSEKLEIERNQNAEDVQNLNLQKTAVETELRATETSLQESRNQASRFSEVLGIQNAKARGLLEYQGRLGQRLQSISRELLAAGEAMGQGGPTIFDSISANLERIHTPSIWWRVAKALGLFRLAQAGMPIDATDRRAIASELKIGLRDIRKVLGSQIAAPEDVAWNVTRLFELHKRAAEIAGSLGIWASIRSRATQWNYMHWVGRASGSFYGKRPAAALFDSTWYLSEYPDVAASDVDPLSHYFDRGAKEGRNPNPIFETNWYLSHNPDVAAAGLNPLEHYWESGAGEGRDPGPLFNTNWYLSENPDIARDGVNPLQHYLQYGITERRDPHPLFDCAYYFERYPELDGLNPVEHYLKKGNLDDVNKKAAASGMNPPVYYGIREGQEGLNPNAIFETKWYLDHNPDVVSAGLNPLEHYWESGAREGRDPNPLFSTSWYLSENPDVAKGGINPLQHYLRYGITEGRDPHPLFRTAYYLKQNPDLEGLSPIQHYLKKAYLHGVSPHPLFDAKWYVEQYQDVVFTNLDPLLHYLETGWREGRNPHPLFDSSWYLESNADVRASGENPLIHYLTVGSKEGRDPHPLFDSSWYRASDPEACPPGVDPLTHYLETGAAQGRDPHPLFDTSWYLEVNPDIGAIGVNPLVHYSISGGAEGRDPHPLFDSSWYLETNPDVRQSGTNPLRHYLLSGAKEGRDPHPLFQGRYYQEQRRAVQFSPVDLSTPQQISHGGAARRSASRTGVVYAFTSICLNYIPKAVVLARTLKKHNPDVHFCVLVSDQVPEGALRDIDVFDEVVTLQDLNISEKASWVFRHSVVELCTAVKGFFMVDLLERADCRAAFYFDPDIVCFAPLEVLTEKLEKASILLTPHLTDPEVTTEAIWDNEICALKHGVYNLGFLGVRPSSEGRRFAQWWRDRLRDFCRADIPGGLFTDQRWVDLAPALFQELEIIRHPGCNAATWNLTNRNIEGDFDEGFTVNGEPLIFYHFSGFDSGAQGAMLDKYGGEMPAAQLLRKWYIQETMNSGDAHFGQFLWALASFSNGEPISEDHRLLYRDRLDLRRAFPNPFDASRPGASYYHWYRSEVLGRPVPFEASDDNPLIEFLDAQLPANPNPFFDCLWYLKHYPDVLTRGLNPLVHFVVWGAGEGRKPNPTFDPSYYMTQLLPEEQNQNPLSHYIYRGLRENRRTDPRYHPVADADLRRRLLLWCKTQQPVILLVSHYGGGGTEKHLRDLIDSVGDKARFLQLTPGRDGLVRLAPRSQDTDLNFVFDPAEQFGALRDLLKECEPQRIHIHHILGNEEYLGALVRELDRPFDFTIHDYYVLAPSPHLIGPDARFVGEDLEAHKDELVAASIAPRRPSSLDAWQTAHRWLVTDAERVIVPSNDVARRFRRFFPDFDPIVAAHPGGPNISPRVKPPILDSDGSLRIAILGDFLPHKGKDTVLACARIARAQNQPLIFELLGDACGDSHLLAEAGVWASGRYQDSGIHKLIRDRNPHAIWYPSICPETYSYTLSIGLEAALPLIVTDIGSLPERVAGRPWAWICSWDMNPLEWISFFVRIRELNFLQKAPPEPPAGSMPPVSRFYRTDYWPLELKDVTPFV